MAEYTAALPAFTRPALDAGVIRRCAYWVPLAATLAAQAILTARLIHTSYASPDESRYIYSGHQLIHELWHGGGSPYYETYLSGAPVAFPVLAAVADHFGGLVAVRLVSLSFMLTATALLFATGRRLFGYWPGICAAALFAGLGLTQDLGAYGTYDAMSVAGIAFAAYCAARTSPGDLHPDRWLLLVPAALLAANAVKYATLVFDPVVISLAALQVGRDGWRRAGDRIVAVGVTAVALLVLAVFLAGTAYLKGLMFTTLARQGGTNPILGATSAPPGVILADSWAWTGAVLVLAAAAVAIAALERRGWHHTALAGLLFAAGLIVTVEALRLHSDESMRKHDDFGIWFSCLAAGYALSWAPTAARSRPVKATLAILAAGAVMAAGGNYSAAAAATYEAREPVGLLPAFAVLRPYLNTGGRYLLGGIYEDDILYTDHLNVPWWGHFNDVYVKYPIPGRGGDSRGNTPGRPCLALRPGCVYLEGPAGYAAAIRAHWFALVSMVGNHGIKQDTVIQSAAEHTPGYVLLTRAGGAPTWIYAPDYRHRQPAPARTVRSAARPPGPSALVIARGFTAVMVPALVFMAAGFLLTGLAVWQRRRRQSPSYAPLWAWAFFLLVMVTAVTLGLAEMATGWSLIVPRRGQHAAGRGRPALELTEASRTR